jgi:hypothetical protein
MGPEDAAAAAEERPAKAWTGGPAGGDCAWLMQGMAGPVEPCLAIDGAGLAVDGLQAKVCTGYSSCGRIASAVSSVGVLQTAMGASSTRCGLAGVSFTVVVAMSDCLESPFAEVLSNSGPRSSWPSSLSRGVSLAIMFL